MTTPMTLGVGLIVNQIAATRSLFASAAALSADARDQLERGTAASLLSQIEGLDVVSLQDADRLNIALADSGFAAQNRTSFGNAVATKTIASVGVYVVYGVVRLRVKVRRAFV